MAQRSPNGLKAVSYTHLTILKFFLNIDSGEQKRRLQERLSDPDKQWKLSRDDFEERRLWPKYMKAYQQALEATTTDFAPWYIVPSNKKWFRDLLVSAEMCIRDSPWRTRTWCSRSWAAAK